MEVKTKEVKQCLFSDIPMGGVFRLNGKLYMRIDLVERAVHLKDGKVVVAVSSNVVQPVEVRCEEV